MTEIATRFRIRRDTAANWSSVNPVLLEAEPALETDTLFVKYGDGVTAWNSLAYAGEGPATAPIEADVPSTSAVSLTSGAADDVTFVDLPVGVWSVSGNVAFFPAGTTDMTILRAWISETAATQPSPPNLGAFQQLVLPFSIGSGQTISAGTRTVTVSSGTLRVYLGTRCTFGVSTLDAGGHIIAIKVA